MPKHVSIDQLLTCAQHWKLLIWCDTPVHHRLYKLAREPIARTACSMGKNDAQHTTHVTSR